MFLFLPIDMQYNFGKTKNICTTKYHKNLTIQSEVVLKLRMFDIFVIIVPTALKIQHTYIFIYILTYLFILRKSS